MTTLAELVVKIVADSSQFEKEISGMSGKLRHIGQGMADIGKGLTMKLTLPIVAAGAAAFKLHKDFEFSMQQIVGLVGVSQDQVNAWKDDLVRMGPELGKSPKELADALYFVTSAGFKGAEALDILEASAKASAAGLGETKTIADLVTSAVNAYGAENLSAAHATDILVAAVREGKAEAADMAGSLGKVLPIAAELGVEFHEVAAATAAMTRTGTDANTAGTQLRAIMSSLLKPTKQAEEVLEAMGTSSANLRKQIREEGLLSALMELRTLTHEYGEEAMAAVFPNIRALIGMLDLMGANMEENVKIFDNLTDATGALDHAFETASQTAEFKWQQAISSVQALMITIGDAVKKAVIPVIEDFVKKIQNMIKWFQNLSSRQQENIVRWFALAAALGPVLMITGKLIVLFVKVGNAIVWLTRGMRLAIATIKLKVAALAGLKTAMALMSGPAGWIMLAVAAVGALGYAFWKATRDSEDALAEMRRKTEAELMSINYTIRQQVIEGLEAAIAEFESFSENSVQIFKNMLDSQAEVGKAGFELLLENMDGEKQQKLDFLEEQYQEELGMLEKMYEDGLIATEKQYIDMKATLSKNYSDKKGIVETGYAEINSIIAGALKEGRELLDGEKQKIIEIYEGMYADILGKLKKHVADYKAIEVLKGLDVSEMTREQYAEYLKIVESGFDSMREEQTDYYTTTATELETMLGRNAISIEDYEYAMEISYKRHIDAMTDINKTQLEMLGDVREEWVLTKYGATKSAEGMREGVNREIDAMNDHALQEIGSMQMGIIDIFKDLWRQIVGRSIVPDIVNDSLAEFRRLNKESGSIFNDIVKNLGQQAIKIGTSIVQGVIDGVKRMAKTAVDTIRNLVRDMIQAAKRLLDSWSPSRVFVDLGEGISKGLAMGVEQTSNLAQSASADLINSTFDGIAGMSHGGNGGGANVINLDATYNITSKELAHYANDDLVKKLQFRGLRGVNR